MGVPPVLFGRAGRPSHFPCGSYLILIPKSIVLDFVRVRNRYFSSPSKAKNKNCINPSLHPQHHHISVCHLCMRLPLRPHTEWNNLHLRIESYPTRYCQRKRNFYITVIAHTNQSSQWGKMRIILINCLTNSHC